ncbi:MAG: hypothetical protein JNK48_06320 [Bryobacterales bacterium]|nr:hypothetical protein [Bryobacterales bacterium]
MTRSLIDVPAAVTTGTGSAPQLPDTRLTRFYCGESSQIVDAWAFDSAASDLVALFHATRSNQ